MSTVGKIAETLAIDELSHENGWWYGLDQGQHVLWLDQAC